MRVPLLMLAIVAFAGAAASHPALAEPAVPQSVSQRAAEKLEVNQLAAVLFGELGEKLPEHMTGYFISGNAGWPPFLFSEVWILGTPNAAPAGPLCEVTWYDIRLGPADPNTTLDDQRGPDSPRIPQTVIVEKRYHALEPGQSVTSACQTMHLIKAPTATDAARAVEILTAISPRFGPDAPFKVTCSGSPACNDLVGLRALSPSGLTDVGPCDEQATTCHFEFNTAWGPGSWMMDVTLTGRDVTSVSLTARQVVNF